MTDGLGVEPSDDLDRLSNPAELLFRQAYPGWVKDGEVSSQLFKPTTKDEGKLSVARGELTTEIDAFVHHTEVLGLASAGTWAVTVEEATAADRESYGEPTEDDPAHGFLDFRGLGRGPAERSAKILLASARQRGCLHPLPH